LREAIVKRFVKSKCTYLSRRDAVLGGVGMATALLTAPRRALSQSKTKVTLTINFIPRGDFAFPYLARERGYYAEHGLDVTIKHVLGNAFAFQMLSSNQSQFVHADIVQMLQLQGKSPEPKLRSVAIDTDKIPLSLFFIKGRGIEKPKDLEGRTIVDSPGATTEALLKLLAKANGFDEKKVMWKSAAANAKVAIMLQDQADAVSIYFPAFPSTASKLPAGRELGAFNFGDYGVDIYGDGLVTQEKLWQEKPALVKAFTQATIKGAKDSYADPTAAADAMIKDHPEVNRELAIKEMEIQRDANVGRNNVGLGYHDAAKMAATYQAVTELLNQPIGRPVTDFYTNDALKG
jgi:NitT/TauT family transport system substrate-binding protein